MTEHRQSVREYVRVTETLLKTEDLSVAERHAITYVLMHLSEKLLTEGKP